MIKYTIFKANILFNKILLSSVRCDQEYVSKSYLSKRKFLFHILCSVYIKAHIYTLGLSTNPSPS